MSVTKGNDLELGDIIGGGTLTLPASARDKHLYVAGGTGSGKSKFLERLIRQDIANWPKSRSGLLLLDPHGSLYDSLVDWLAAHQVNRKLILIDLRRNDWVPSYNLLRKRAVANPSVIVDNLIEAMAHVWGESGTDRTPLFARWAANTLHALYDKGHTLVEASHLTNRTSSQIRRSMTHGLADQIAEQDWHYANDLSPKEFENAIGSTLNRLGRFLRNPHIRAIIGHAGHSLDLRQALDEGHIILVSLAREGARVSREDSELFATLLLNDLWTAAQERGKRKGIKPFYVYLDEFQRFVSPTISENLDEARGFGLHLTMTHQFPNQLRNAGEHGQRLYDSVMENASTKVVFRLSNPENLEPLAQSLFMGCLDPDEVKHRLYSTKVVGYRDEIRYDHTRGSAKARGGTQTDGSSEGGGESGQREVYADGTPVISPDETELRAWNVFATQASSSADTWSEGESESETERIERVPILGPELSSVQFRGLDEQLFRAMQKLFRQKDRHCAVRVVGEEIPIFLRTIPVTEKPVSNLRREAYIATQFKRWPFYLTMEDATKRLDARHKELLASALDATGVEAVTAKRRLPRA